MHKHTVGGRGGGGQGNTQGWWDLSTNPVTHTEGQVIGQGNQHWWERSKGQDPSCARLFSFFSGFVLKASPSVLRPKALSWMYVHRSQEHLCLCTSDTPNALDNHVKLSGPHRPHTVPTNSKAVPCPNGLRSQHIQLTESQGIFCVCQYHSQNSQTLLVKP